MSWAAARLAMAAARRCRSSSSRGTWCDWNSMGWGRWRIVWSTIESDKRSECALWSRVMHNQAVGPLASPAFSANERWIDEHIDELLKTYPNQWIAVHGGQVLASGPSLDVVECAVAGTAPPTDVVFDFLNDGTRIYL